MKKIQNFSDMSYVDFISFLNETNRCPGGKDTMNWILQNSFATKDTNVLEIGSNTGFSSLEVARTIKCKVLGIDVVPTAVEAAKAELNDDVKEIRKLVKFKVGSAYDVPCKDNTIDLIIAGGSVSFMDKKSTAVNEMHRVLKPWGICSVTNLFYHTKPPKKVLDDVSKILGIKINYMSAKDWLNIYTENKTFEVYKFETEMLSNQPKNVIDDYINYFMDKPHIKELSNSDKEQIRKKWSDILMVFNENHKYLGFIKCLLRKRPTPEEPELFTIKRQ